MVVVRSQYAVFSINASRQGMQNQKKIYAGKYILMISDGKSHFNAAGSRWMVIVCMLRKQNNSVYTSLVLLF